MVSREIESLRRACAEFDDSVCDVISGDTKPIDLMNGALERFREAYASTDDLEPGSTYDLFDGDQSKLLPRPRFPLFESGRSDISRSDISRAEWRGVYPGMCIDPETCRGKTHCPRNYSCCE